MKQPLSFSKLKLTNNTADQNGHVNYFIFLKNKNFHELISFRLYLIQCISTFPRLHIIETLNCSKTTPLDNVNIFVFPETQFLAVTAYQNDNVNN